ncbi:hypothetical protein CALVIDRAFT_144336 [Calocera viscosa TUFC12733]|uniref:Uncharacterized protein n=1 Tax=Calocera viscosa (strain TUFC12733) TaxID=1330018 RepID=A0A167LRT1_CALVF|nr:hypothetical protein CALVIDRAFT_144336 [Calocera viscosa TUFC12733]
MGVRSGYEAERENKRFGDGLEDFFNDAKRRRYASAHDSNTGNMYDQAMAARLNELSPGFLQSHGQQGQQMGNFTQAMSTAVTSDNDLAQINGALLQLHKAISGSTGFDSHDLSHSNDALLSDQELAALGLAGMPGINVNNYNDSNPNGYTVHSQYAMPAPAHQSVQRYAQQTMQHQPHPAVSPSHHSPHQQYGFSSYPQLVPQLDVGGMSSVRTQRIPRLKEAPMSPSAMDVELTRERSRSSSPPIRHSRRVYEDPDLKLPAISSSTSPDISRPSTSGGVRSPPRTSLPPISSLNITESEKRALPTRLYPRLPPLSSILSPTSPSSPSPISTPTQAPYARGGGGSYRPSTERIRHAKLVKDLLIMVNREWQQRERGDVEMSS